MCAAWPTVPSIAAICACVVSIMISQSQHSHDAPSRGPGSESNASRVVRPCVIAYRPSSTCTKTLMMHDSRISQSRLKPASAPRLVVLISSPVPTIEAARISPGPICPMRPAQRVRRLADRVGGQGVEVLMIVMVVEVALAVLAAVRVAHRKPAARAGSSGHGRSMMKPPTRGRYRIGGVEGGRAAQGAGGPARPRPGLAHHGRVASRVSRITGRSRLRRSRPGEGAQAALAKPITPVGPRALVPERTVGWYRECRRLATRYETSSFQAGFVERGSERMAARPTNPAMQSRASSRVTGVAENGSAV